MTKELYQLANQLIDIVLFYYFASLQKSAKYSEIQRISTIYDNNSL